MEVSQCILVYEDLIDSGVSLEADTRVPFRHNLSLDRSSANKNLGLCSILQVNWMWELTLNRQQQQQRSQTKPIKLDLYTQQLKACSSSLLRKPNQQAELHLYAIGPVPALTTILLRHLFESLYMHSSLSQVKCASVGRNIDWKYYKADCFLVQKLNIKISERFSHSCNQTQCGQLASDEKRCQRPESDGFRSVPLLSEVTWVSSHAILFGHRVRSTITTALTAPARPIKGRYPTKGKWWRFGKSHRVRRITPVLRCQTARYCRRWQCKVALLSGWRHGAQYCGAGERRPLPPFLQRIPEDKTQGKTNRMLKSRASGTCCSDTSPNYGRGKGKQGSWWRD